VIQRAPDNLGLRADGCYLIDGSLCGLCGSLAIYLAQHGAKYFAVMSRSGHADQISKYVIKQINALGARIDLLTADVTNETQVNMAMQQIAVPIVGIVQGAMVLRVSLSPTAIAPSFCHGHHRQQDLLQNPLQ
jgi:NAD(P)-dependent dehydrogenase (short-subunit alcohol dehydrogenase family)